MKRIRRNRTIVASGVGLCFGLLTRALLHRRAAWIQGADFTYPWLAARFVIHGANPYIAIRHAVTPYQSVMFYPLPVALLAVPFAWMSAEYAAIIFIAVSTAVLAFALTRENWWPLLVFATAPAFKSAWSVQWAPLFTAAALIPALAWLTIGKPNMGLPVLAYHGRRGVRTAIMWGAPVLAVLVTASFAIEPRWVVDWIGMLRSSPVADQYRIPLLTPWGWWLVLILAFWRDRDARLLFAMACVPQNFFLYEQLPLMLVARSRAELIALAVTSWLAYFGTQSRMFDQWAESSRWDLPFAIAGVYAPAFILVAWRCRWRSKAMRSSVSALIR